MQSLWHHKTLDASVYADIMIPVKNTARLYKALADETRLRIISLLLENGELCVCDLMETLDMPQSTVSRHLAYLRGSDLVNDRRKGVWMYYSIKQEVGFTADILAILNNEFKHNKTAINDRRQLAAYLAKKEDRCGE